MACLPCRYGSARDSPPRQHLPTFFYQFARTGQVDWARNIFVKNAKLYETVLEGMWKSGEEEALAIAAVLHERGMKGCRVLDVPCGIGRIGVPLAQLGFSVHGIDVSRDLVIAARRKSVEFGVEKRATFATGDMKKMRIDEAFDSAINVFTSIGYGSEKEDLDFFYCVRRAVRNAGCFLISGLRNRDYIATHPSQNIYEETGDLLVLDRYQFDIATSRERGAWRFFLKVGESLRFAGEFPTSIRIYSPHEVVEMLAKTGWRVLEVVESFGTRGQFSVQNPFYSVLAEAV